MKFLKRKFHKRSFNWCQHSGHNYWFHWQKRKITSHFELEMFLLKCKQLCCIDPRIYPMTCPGNSKGGSLYCWPPVWLVWNRLCDNWQFLFLFEKQAPKPLKQEVNGTVIQPPLVFPGLPIHSLLSLSLLGACILSCSLNLLLCHSHFIAL